MTWGFGTGYGAVVVFSSINCWDVHSPSMGGAEMLFELAGSPVGGLVTGEFQRHHQQGDPDAEAYGSGAMSSPLWNSPTSLPPVDTDQGERPMSTTLQPSSTAR